MLLIRSCIYPKDVQRITGRSLRAAERLVKKIRKAKGKQEEMFITTDEFAAYTGIDPDVIRQYIDD